MVAALQHSLPGVHRRWLIALAVLALAAAAVAYRVERDFGRVEIVFVQIPDPSGAVLAAKLYRPASFSTRKLPGVLALHGYQNDKETQDSFAIELARRGFVVLAVDHLGHGSSGGSLNFAAYFADPTYTMGAGAGYDYLKQLPFVDSENLGVIGHSMGAMTAVKVGFLNPDHRGMNSQCGPSGDRRLHNLLVTQARFEEFRAFREDEPRVEKLTTNRKRLDAFGLSGPILWDTTYGNMDDGSARRAALIDTVHAGVTHSPKAVTDTLDWMRRALRVEPRADDIRSDRHIYLWKEASMLVALLATLLTLVPLTNLMLASPLFEEVAVPLPAGPVVSPRTWWRLATINAVIGGVTFPVLTRLNRFLIGVPGLALPMGNGVLIWFLGNSLICLTMFLLWFRKESKVRTLTLEHVGASLGRSGAVRVLAKTIGVAALLVGWMYALEGLSERVLGIEFRFIWPFMRQFSARRFGLFWLYLLPAFLFFLVNGGLFLFGQARQPESSSPRRTLWIWWLKNLYAGLFGLLIIWAIQYIPFLWFGQPPGFEALGLPQYAEMWPLMLLVFLPTFAVLLLLLTWFFCRTGRIYLGALVISSLAIWFTAAGSVIGR